MKKKTEKNAVDVVHDFLDGMLESLGVEGEDAISLLKDVIAHYFGELIAKEDLQEIIKKIAKDYGQEEKIDLEGVDEKSVIDEIRDALQELKKEVERLKQNNAGAGSPLPDTRMPLPNPYKQPTAPNPLPNPYETPYKYPYERPKITWTGDTTNDTNKMYMANGRNSHELDETTRRIDDLLNIISQ